MTVGLGIDTGGTYTDGVIIDVDTGKIISKKKSRTTHDNLVVGIRGAISEFDPELLKQVQLVSLSSTLATNSVVEGKGCKVAIVCVGQPYDGTVPVESQISISGGHDMDGFERTPLDEEGARRFLEEVHDRVDAIVINSFLAIKNPEHENRVKEIARSITDKPIVCGHDLSSQLGFNERTTTAIMNAMLLPVIDELIVSVKAVMQEFSINAPLMIVRGDGYLMSEEMAREKPVETILSGPAASLFGAMKLTGVKDAIVVDIGGTTTDIGIIRKGKPRLEPEGATIGGKRTRVLAAEISTSGIGGDSRIYVENGVVKVSPVRAIPMCVAAQKWECVKMHLEEVLKGEIRIQRTDLGERTTVLDNEMFCLVKDPVCPPELGTAATKLVELLQYRPFSLREAAKMLNEHPYFMNIGALEDRRIVQRIAFTPTDLLHCLGTYTEFDVEASKLAMQYIVRAIGSTEEIFLAQAKEAIRSKICREFLNELIREQFGTDDLGEAGKQIRDMMYNGSQGMDFVARMLINKPIIGIGASSGVYIKWLADSVGAEFLHSPDSDVGNAVGAVSASFAEQVTVTIFPDVIGLAKPKYYVTSVMGKKKFKNLDEALAYAEEIGREYVSGLMAKNKCDDYQITVETERFETGLEEKILNRIEMLVMAKGKPKI